MNLRSNTNKAVAAIAGIFISTSAAFAQQRVEDLKPTASSLAYSQNGAFASTSTSTLPLYTIGSGDVLSISVWKEKELSQTVTVRPDGKISLPLLGEISVVGNDPAQLEATLQARLQSIVVEPRVTVTVLEIHSRVVYITGEVTRPGAYPLNSSISVLQLIAQAGGLTEFAHKKKIHIVRAGSASNEASINYKNLVQGSSSKDHALQLNPGDTVVIP